MGLRPTKSDGEPAGRSYDLSCLRRFFNGVPDGPATKGLERLPSRDSQGTVAAYVFPWSAP